MQTLYILPAPRSRASALALTVLAHLALLLAWQASRARAPAPSARDTSVPIEWFALTPRASEPARPPQAARPPAPGRAHPAPAPTLAPTRPMTLVPPAPLAPSADTATPAPATPLPQAPSPPALSADDILQRARHDVGKIDRDLRATSLHKLTPPANTAQTRLLAGMEKATAPPKLWEAPRIESVTDQGGTTDRRIYKVTTGNGVYCITVESNHSPDGLDSMKNGIHQKILTCPREE